MSISILIGISILDALYKILYYLYMIKTIPISEARKDFPTLVDNAEKKLDEYIITVNGSPQAVLMSVKEYESWKETIAILSDPGLMEAIKEGERDIKEGRVYDWEDVEKELGLDVQNKNLSKSQKRAQINL